MKTFLQYTFFIFALFLLFIQVRCNRFTGTKNNSNIEVLKNNSSETKPTMTEKSPNDITNASKVSSSTDATKIGEIIFVSNSEACHCTLERCDFIRERLKSILLEDKRYENVIEINEIDYAKARQQIAKIYEQYKLWFIPSVILINKTGKIYYQSSYNFDETLFKEKIKLMVNDNSEKDGK